MACKCYIITATWTEVTLTYCMYVHNYGVICDSLITCSKLYLLYSSSSKSQIFLCFKDLHCTYLAALELLLSIVAFFFTQAFFYFFYFIQISFVEFEFILIAYRLPCHARWLVRTRCWQHVSVCRRQLFWFSSRNSLLYTLLFLLLQIL